MSILSSRAPLKLAFALLCATVVPFAYQSKQGGGAPPKKQGGASPQKAARTDEGIFFRWDRPQFLPDRLPITKSATCRFKRSVATMLLTSRQDNHSYVQYSSADEDEADTVSFVDLDTEDPKVVSNGGQAPLYVLFNKPNEIALVNRTGLSVFELEFYTIFKDSGAVLHSTQHRALGIDPSGVTEMGYCN